MDIHQVHQLPRTFPVPGTSKQENMDVDQVYQLFDVDVKTDPDNDEEDITVEWSFASTFRRVGSSFPSDLLMADVLAFVSVSLLHRDHILFSNLI